MNFLTLAIFGLLGLLVLPLLAAFVLLIAGAVGALVKMCMGSDERSMRYGARATKLTYGILVTFICYQAYSAVFPSTGFYLDEFETVTARPAPAEATIIAKDATYPDLHGDYCSFSRIKFSASSYLKLLNELKADKRFTSGGGDGEISKGGLAASDLPPLRILINFARSDVKSDYIYRISFLENGSEIEVTICVT